MRVMRCRSRCLVAAFGLALLAAVPSVAQIPDEFKNLKVLPTDIGKQQLVEIMRSWSNALGQRCSYCHVGPDNLQGMDFVTDENKHKVVARTMARMVGEINGKLIPAAGLEDATQVRCVTCHRGVSEPESIDRIVLEVAAESGVPAALERYAALRQEYFGSAAYDFGAGPLNTVAESLARDRQDLDGAIAVAKANIEYHPDKAPPHVLLGQFYAGKGDRAAALTEMQKALAIEPEAAWIRRQIQQLEQVKPSE